MKQSQKLKAESFYYEKATKMTNRRMWLFQANPKKYTLLDALADANTEEDVWQVTRYKKEIRSGHIGLIWKCGEEKGIYAIVDVTSNVQPLPESPQVARYWIKDEDRNLIIDRVRIHRSLNIRNTPILEEELIRIPHFNVENIFRNFRNNTNFKVENNERDIILELPNRKFGYVP